MTWVSGIFIYAIIWWVVLFAVLPFGVRSQQEEGDVSFGTEPAAPARHHLGKKFLATTGVSFVLFLLLWLLMALGLLDFRAQA
ncbi:MAG: DUF1467 family protein [Pseudomonadota bacterium]